jgi:hypothetical protein
MTLPLLIDVNRKSSAALPAKRTGERRELTLLNFERYTDKNALRGSTPIEQLSDSPTAAAGFPRGSLR